MKYLCSELYISKMAHLAIARGAIFLKLSL